MQNQSKNKIIDDSVVAPIKVNPEFPVAIVDYNTRGENPDIKPHIHNMCEIGYCFAGTGIFLIANKVFSFKAGDGVFITSKEFHYARGNAGQETTWGFLNFDPLGLIPSCPENPSIRKILGCCCGKNFCNIFDGNQYPELTACIRKIITERRNARKNWQPMIRAGVWELLLLLSRICPEEIDSDDDYGNYEDSVRIMSALNYMNLHYSEKITLSDLARACHTSIPNFRKLFCKAMGIAPYPYLSRLRIKYACSLMENQNEPLYQIACQTGFNEISNFNRQFQNIIGMSPSQYRQQIIGKKKIQEQDSLF